MRWVAVCEVADLRPDDGAVALVGGEQVALIRTTGASGLEQVYAVEQRDPYSGAHVMARGIVGSRGGRPTLASPMWKQVFDLSTGECLDSVGAPVAHLRTWPVQIEGGRVLVGAREEPGGEAPGEAHDEAGGEASKEARKRPGNTRSVLASHAPSMIEA